MIALWLLTGVLAAPGGVDPPEPTPPPPPATAGRGVRLLPRYVVTIDGVSYTGTREEVMALVAGQAQREAIQEPPPATVKKAKAAARKAARQAPQVEVDAPADAVSAEDLAERMALIDTLRREAQARFRDEFVARLLLVRQQIEDDNQAAIAAAEMML